MSNKGIYKTYMESDVLGKLMQKSFHIHDVEFDERRNPLQHQKRPGPRQQGETL